MKTSIIRLLLFSTIILVGWGPRVHAGLGGDATTVETDRTNLGLKRGEAKSLEKFKTEEMFSNKVRVRQYISPAGKIFALAWSGRMDSQLNDLLGPYAKDFQSYEQTHPKRGGRTPYRKVDTGHVVLEFWDTLRNVQGKAFVPGLAPESVTAQDVHIK